MSSDNNRADILLNALRIEEEQTRKGKLRVFLGMSAGVGKTYAMLRAAHARKAEGLDVVIGYVETHGRPETVALVENLPLIARRAIEYRGVRLEEMDIDAILSRSPQLVLVDELAHTNIPGSRHTKRYQDVHELLEQGIDVYTTVNVQHLESRKDLVEKITKVAIRETVPDSVLDRANLVELVDIAPPELLRRLSEGKVYLGDKAQRAAENFFKPDALTALREISLRVTAERVDQDLQRYHETKSLTDPWQSNERLMVAVSHSPYSERLVRATRRLAYNLEAPWIAVHVDTGLALSDEDQAQLNKNISLARELGAEVVTTAERDVAAALRRVARQKNITQLILGRPTQRFLRDRVEGTLLDRLVKESFEIDVHVIRQDKPLRETPRESLSIRWDAKPLSYWNTACFMAGLSLINGIINPYIGYRAVGFLFLLGVLLVGSISSLGPAIAAAVASAFIWNYFFIPPLFTILIREPADIIMCVTYLFVAAFTGYLTSRVRLQERILREREDRTNVLYEISQDIAQARGKTEFLSSITQRVGRLLNGACGVVVASPEGKLTFTDSRLYAPSLDEKEQAKATWAFESGKPAGWSTETLAESKNLFIPLLGRGETVGVFVYEPRSTRKLSLEQQNLLYAIARQLATALERHFLEKRAGEAHKLEQSEKLHQTVLNSVSHEMRTPLTAIIGSATALEDATTATDPVRVKELAGLVLESSDRLNRVVENLLDMSRLSSGKLQIKSEWHDIHDLLNITVSKLKKNLSKHKLLIDAPADLPMVELDFRLFEHALSNLVLNAAAYTPPGTEVKILVRARGERLRIAVEDQGAGIPEELREQVFEKFYRVPGTPAGGTGLGLSIVKSIVEAHGGTIYALASEGGGALFSIELPLRKVPDVPEEEES